MKNDHGQDIFYSNIKFLTELQWGKAPKCFKCHFYRHKLSHVLNSLKNIYPFKTNNLLNAAVPNMNFKVRTDITQ